MFMCFLGVEQYFGELTKFYPGVPTDDLNNQVIKPNLHSFVFLKSKKAFEGVIVDEGGSNPVNDVVDVNEGSQFIISYYSVSTFVKNGDMHLI